tara:strand:+ start:1753 stop:1980 length:228 start_codon:yes stop_codon:yes gene_type:complete
MAIDTSRRGQGVTWGIHSDNRDLMTSVFQQCGLRNLSGQRLNHATAFFNRAFAQGRNDFQSNLSWFRSLMGLRNN